MSKDWYIGQEVVCVNDRSFGSYKLPIKAGEVYKIRGFDTEPPFVLEDFIFGMGIYLEGIHRDFSTRTGKEYSFYKWRFKPVEKPKSEKEMEIFQKILDGVNNKVKIDVKEEEKV